MHITAFRTTLIFSLVLGLIASSLQAAELGQWRNALKPAGNSSGDFIVSENGQARCAILIPQKPTTQEKKAADDLRQWMQQITGAELPIVDQVAAGQKCISIGNTALSAQDRGRDLGDEGYGISITDGNLILKGGRTRGIINAVYALLEEDLGCRWYTQTDTRLPHLPSLTIAPVARTYVPQLRVRDPFYFAAFEANWSLRNRTNAASAHVPDEFGGDVDYGPTFVHTSAVLLPPAKYFKEHPEYFFLDKSGKRNPAQWCATEPEVAKAVTNSVLEYLHEHPKTGIISVSKNDSGGDQLCQCDRCKALREAEGGAEMATQLVLVNHVAEAVEKEYPNVAIDTLAYLDTIAVPKIMRPRHNVVIRLCNDAVGAWVHPFTPAENLPVAKIAEAWAAVHNRIYIWDYHVNFSHYLAPMPNVDVIAANIRFWVKNHAEGVMLQAGYQGPAERDELKSWVAAKILWDPTRDENELTQDFIFGHYGKAAPMLAEYDALLVKAGKDHAKDLASPAGGIRYEMNNPFLSKEFLETSTEIFSRAREAAAGDDELFRRVERAELPILYVKLMQGPKITGPEYKNVLDTFERIAKRENAIYMCEASADLPQKLEGWRKQIAK